MRRLPDGRYEIENSQTGEKRVITEAELPDYGLAPEQMVRSQPPREAPLQATPVKAPQSPLVKPYGEIGRSLGNVAKSVLPFTGDLLPNIGEKVGSTAGGVAGAVLKAPERLGTFYGKSATNVAESSRLQKDAETNLKMIDTLNKQLVRAQESGDEDKVREITNKIGKFTLKNQRIAQNLRGIGSENKDLGMEGVKGSLGTAAFFTPTIEGSGLVPAASRIATSTTSGAASGFGASEKGQGLKRAGQGALLAGAVATGLEGVRALAGKGVGVPSNEITKPDLPKDLVERAKRFDDPTEFANSLTLQEIDEISGINTEQLNQMDDSAQIGDLMSEVDQKLQDFHKQATGGQLNTQDKLVERIISKTKNIEKTSPAKRTEIKMMSEAFPMSKSGYSFQRYKPQETWSQLLDDGVTGSADDILRKSETVSGENGVLSNIVNESVLEVDQPLELGEEVSSVLRPENIQGRLEAVDIKDLKDLSQRLGRVAPSPDSVTGKEATGLFDFVQTLDKEAADVFAKQARGNVVDTKSLQLAKVKFELADAIQDSLDLALREQGVSTRLAQDPRILQTLSDEVSPELAQRVSESGGRIDELRAIQKDYVRANKIIRRSLEEASSLGTKFFGGGQGSMSKYVGNVPIVSGALDAAGGAMKAPALTRGASFLHKAREAVGGLQLPSIPNIPVPPVNVGAFAGPLVESFYGGEPDTVSGATPIPQQSLPEGAAPKQAGTVPEQTGTFPEQTSPTVQSPGPQIPAQTVRAESATGYTTQQHLQALSRAIEAGDQQAAQLISQQLEIQQAQDQLSEERGADPETLGKVNVAEDNLDELESLLDSVGPFRGRVGGKLASLTGQTAPKVYQYNQFRDSMIAPLARLISGETGMLNESDIKRADGLLPRVGEDPGIAEGKLNRLRRLLNNIKQQPGFFGSSGDELPAIQ